MSEHDQPGPERPDPEWVRQRFEERLGELREGVGSLFPPEFKAHARAARRAFWLAVRSLVDARLDAIEEEARHRPSGGEPRGRIDVE